MFRVVCYGAGNLFDEFMSVKDDQICKVTAVLDQDKEKAWRKIKGRETGDMEDVAVLSPEEIRDESFDFIVLCSMNYEQEMKDTLLQMGVPEGKICSMQHSYGREKILSDEAETYLEEKNQNKEILSCLIKADIHTFVLIKDMLNLHRSRAVKSFYQKAQRDYVRYSTLELLAMQIHRKGVIGDCAELGVYQGELSAVINELFPNRKLYLFDTFEGFRENDCQYDSENQYSLIEQVQNYFKDTSASFVISRMPYPEQCIVKQGFFPESLGEMKTDDTMRFCLVSLDPDLYMPVYEGIHYFYPRLSKGGYMLVHDYECPNFRGARRAIEDACRELHVNFVPLPDENGSVIIAK